MNDKQRKKLIAKLDITDFRLLNHNDLTIFIEYVRLANEGTLAFESHSVLYNKSKVLSSFALTTTKNSFIKLRANGWLNSINLRLATINPIFVDDTKTINLLKKYVKGTTFREHSAVSFPKDLINNKVLNGQDFSFRKTEILEDMALEMSTPLNSCPLVVVNKLVEANLSHFKVGYFLKLLQVIPNGEIEVKNLYQLWKNNKEILGNAQTSANGTMRAFQDKNWITVEKIDVKTTRITVNKDLFENENTVNIFKNYSENLIPFNALLIFIAILDISDEDGVINSHKIAKKINDFLLTSGHKQVFTSIYPRINILAKYGYIEKFSKSHIRINKSFWLKNI